MPIGSELKSGKIPKRDNFNEKSESDNVVPSSSTGQFGAIADRTISNTPCVRDWFAVFAKGYFSSFSG